jgi:uncharacterized protein (DUF433 family)
MTLSEPTARLPFIPAGGPDCRPRLSGRRRRKRFGNFSTRNTLFAAAAGVGYNCSTMSTTLATTLVRTPGVCGGKLRIDGTRMTVGHIVAMYRRGLSPEQIVEQHPQRTIGEIFAVLAWYHEHRQEFDAEMAADAERDELAAQQGAADVR